MSFTQRIEKTEGYARLLRLADLMDSEAFRSILSLVPFLGIVRWTDGTLGFYSTESPVPDEETQFRNVFLSQNKTRKPICLTTAALGIKGRVRPVLPVWKQSNSDDFHCSCINTNTGRSAFTFSKEGYCPHIFSAVFFGIQPSVIDPKDLTVREGQTTPHFRSTHFFPSVTQYKKYVKLYDPLCQSDPMLNRLLMNNAGAGLNGFDIGSLDP